MFFIYRLTDGEQDYYGQTENVERRFREHKTRNECSSRLLDKSKMKIHIIHRLYTQQEADETEAFYQLNFECVNTQITGRTQKEYYQANKEERAIYNKKHREDKKEHYKEYGIKYNQENREKISEKFKKYSEENKEKIAENKKKYYVENKEKLLEKFDCECGGKYTFNHKKRHFKSKIHQNYISSIKQEE